MITKRLVSIIIALSLIIVAFPLPYVAEANTSDTAVMNSVDEGLSLDETMSMGLGIIEGDYRSDDIATVKELADAVKVLDYTAYTLKTYFTEAEYNNELKYVTALAVFLDILGYSAFFDDTKIDEEDVDEIFRYAKRYGISNGVNIDLQSSITRYHLATLVWNTLNADTLEWTYTNDSSCVTVTNIPFMERAHELYTVNDVVKTTKISTIEGNDEANRDYVTIGNRKYDYGENNFESFFGKNVTALIKKGDVIDTVVAMYSYGNEVIKLDHEDINPSNTNKTQVSYYGKNDKVKNVKFASDVDVLYNNELFYDYDDDDFRITEGKMTLIDNDEDRLIDIVMIEKYNSMFVYTKSLEAETIIDAYGNSLNMSYIIENNIPIMKDGNIINFNDIARDDVITYMVNKAGEVSAIYVTHEFTGGTVNQFDKENNIITISGKEYYYSNVVKEQIESVNMGTLLNVAFDYFGEIAYVRDEKSAFLYGYLVGAAKGSGFSVPKVKIYTQEKIFEIFELNDKVTFNGTRMSAQSIFENGFQDIDIGNVCGMVSYKINSKRKITCLNTVTMDKSDGTPGRLIKEKDGQFTYYSTPNSLSSTVRLNRDTKVFIVPYDLSYTGRYNYSNFTALTNNTKYHAQIFNVDENRYAQIVLIRVDNLETKTIDQIGTAGYIVTEAGIRYINDVGEIAPAVRVKTLGTESSYVDVYFNTELTSKGIKASELKPGDVFYAAQNTRIHREFININIKYIHGKTGAFDYADRDQTGLTFNAITSGFIHAAGTVKRRINNGLMVCFEPDIAFDDNSMDRIVEFSNNTVVSIFDESEQELTSGYIGDIKVGDWVYVVFGNCLAREVVIYRP